MNASPGRQMRKIVFLQITLGLMAASCEEKAEKSSPTSINWQKRRVAYSIPDSLTRGSTYLSIYSQIYSESEHRLHDLTVTVSMRNTSRTDTLYIDKTDYYNTNGNNIRSYGGGSIYIAPMETVEIVIEQVDREGGTGGNFIFDWRTQPDENEPLFEAVMISTYSSQGLSFTTQGVRIE